MPTSVNNGESGTETREVIEIIEWDSRDIIS